MTFEQWWDGVAKTPAPDTFKNWEESCRQAWEAGRAALAGAEPKKISLTNTSTSNTPRTVELMFEAMDKEVAAGRLVRTGPLEWSKPE